MKNIKKNIERVRFGGEYYHLRFDPDGEVSVKIAVDIRDNLDTHRFMIGNYFIKAVDAGNHLRRHRDLIHTFLVAFNNSFKENQ
jgi:hypothetical protein